MLKQTVEAGAAGVVFVDAADRHVAAAGIAEGILLRDEV